jgi:hypothetical protein
VTAMHAARCATNRKQTCRSPSDTSSVRRRPKVAPQ